MREFKDYNPAVVIFYYLITASITMFSMNPVLHLICFAGSLLQFIIFLPRGESKTHLCYFLLGIILAFIRPLFSHNGVTVLFVLNDNPITAESFIFGVNTAVMVVSVLYIFRVFSLFMTSDRLLYVFRIFSPKTALVMSMGLKYIPDLKMRYRMIAQAQTAIGLNKDDNAIDRISGSLKTLSATVTWGLENGIITADSMAARYYGTGKRSTYSLFGFCIHDVMLLIIIAVLCILPVMCLAGGRYDTVFYPEFVMDKAGIPETAGYACYGALLMIPVIMHLLENIRWKYLRSKI